MGGTPEKRLAYCLSPLAMVDLVTIVPVLAKWGGGHALDQSKMVQVGTLIARARRCRSNV